MDKIVVVLVGPQGVGKSTWCREHLPNYLRISQDDQGPRAHFLLFEQAVQRGEPGIIVDRTNAPKYQRKRYLELARQHGYRTRIVWFNADHAECLRRCRERVGHPTLTADKAERALNTYFRNLEPPSADEADEFQFLGTPLDDGLLARIAERERKRLMSRSGPEQVRIREQYVADGLIRSDRTDDGQLAIYTYTDACVYANAWDDVTKYSRGHIFHVETGECVAWPFPKFFNLGENHESMPERFSWDEPFEVHEKLDGWLGVLYRHEGMFKVATRGSFHSSGSQWATAAIQQYDLRCLPPDATLIFEILTPEQRIILDYGQERRVVILGAFNRNTGDEYPRDEVEYWASLTGLPIVTMHPPMTLEQLQQKQKELQQAEGFVLRFGDGRRVKVKTAWYLELARIMSNLSPITVWETMRAGKVPLESLRSIPEELRPLAERYVGTLEEQHARVRQQIEERALPILERFQGDRRALGMFVQQNAAELGQVKSALFLLLDGKREQFELMVKELIYPRGNQFVIDG